MAKATKGNTRDTWRNVDAMYIPGLDRRKSSLANKECAGGQPKFIRYRRKDGKLVTRRIRGPVHERRQAVVSMTINGVVHHVCATCRPGE
jgi:hypothetical protein